MDTPIKPIAECFDAVYKPKKSQGEMELEIDQLKRRIDSMKAKEQEFKRFKSRYQDALQHSLSCTELSERDEREARRLRRALFEIAYAKEDFRRKAIIKYAEKVLNGLGYETP